VLNHSLSIPDFNVRLEFFSGPMDLLLHLVEQQEVPIEKVNLALVCEQYLKVVESCAELDLERAGEFLVVAATLAARKSEALLPSAQPVEGLDSAEGFDPRFFSELRERLTAYKLTKLRSERLLRVSQLDVDVFSPKKQVIEVESDGEEVRGDGQLIGETFFRLLKRIGEGIRGFRVKLEPITVVKYMVNVVDVLCRLGSGARSFIDVVRGVTDQVSTRAKITGSFVAALELAKRGIVQVDQTESGIALSYAGGVPENTRFESEFDSKVVDMAAYREAGESKEEELLEERRKEANRGF
jgi:segregation and condensation protein A